MSLKKRPSTSEVVTLAAPPVAIVSGERFANRYIIEELYGSGPLGFAYRARDAHAERTSLVAVKVLPRDMAPTHAEQVNIIAEIGKLAGREMENVATPLDAGTFGGAAFVVTPWVRGRSLRRILGAYRDAGREMPHEEVVGVIEGVVHALRQLHTLAPHGALYPESVQISSEGRVKLTDAGIAPAIARGRRMDYFERFPDVLPYFAPELRAGKAASAGADLFSLGALVSELLTGDAGAAEAGIAGAMLKGLPEDVHLALRGLVAPKAAARAAALPALLNALTRAVRAKSVPMSATLPPARGRTEVMPPVDEGTRVTSPRKRRSSRNVR